MKSYSLSHATGCLQRMAGRVGFGIMRRELLKPLAERARASCERDQMTAKARRGQMETIIQTVPHDWRGASREGVGVGRPRPRLRLPKVRGDAGLWLASRECPAVRQLPRSVTIDRACIPPTQGASAWRTIGEAALRPPAETFFAS